VRYHQRKCPQKYERYFKLEWPFHFTASEAVMFLVTGFVVLCSVMPTSITSWIMVKAKIETAFYLFSLYA
jgi:hypothetical protein